MKEDDNKVTLLLFSGGLDSSYLLQTYLQEGDVETLYVRGGQHPDKISRELEARRRIIAVLEKKTGNKVRRDHVVDIGQIFNNDIPDSAFAQPPMWIVGALQVSDHYRHRELAIGYVAGDQIACKIPYVTAAWDNLQYFAKSAHIRVVFPLEVTRKIDILDRIWPEVVQHVWVCEMPVWWYDGKPLDFMVTGDYSYGHRLKSCGKCAACITQVGSMAMWKQLHGEPYSHTFVHRLAMAKDVKLEPDFTVGELIEIKEKEE